MADRFICGTGPVITITKCHDLERREMLYDLYLNGKIEGRYTLPEITKKFQEVLYDI